MSVEFPSLLANSHGRHSEIKQAEKIAHLGSSESNGKSVQEQRNSPREDIS